MDSSINSAPLVSIGMPAYNGERYIRKAIDSLTAQDYKNYEVIISDNASNDATLKICQEYADTDFRIKVHAQSHNIGALANFKAVLEPAQGKYFMWAAVDDYWYPEFVSTMVEELEKYPEAGVAMSSVHRVWENGDPFDTVRFIGKDNPNQRSYYQMMRSLTSFKKYNLYIYGLFRTDLLKRSIQFIPEVPGSDRLFICHMALATKFRYRDKILHIRMHHKQPSSVRLPDEKFNRMQNKDKWVDVKIVWAMAQMVYYSTVIPRQRKVYLPVALWRYSKLLFYNRLMLNIKKRISSHRWDILKKIGTRC